MAPAPSPDDGQGPPQFCFALPEPLRDACVSSFLTAKTSAFWASVSQDQETQTQTDGKHAAESTAYPASASSTNSQTPQLTSSPLSSTSQPAAQSGVISTTFYAPAYTTNPGSASSSAPGDPLAAFGDGHHHGGIIHGYMTAVGIIIPLIILGFIIAAIIKIIRIKRAHRKVREAAPEMKDLDPHRPRAENPYVVPPPPSQPPPEGITPTATAPVPQTSRQSQPVILSSTMDRAYFTGLDTADHNSIADVRGQGSDPFAHPDDGDEPPPPYRPRSVPSISRETSARISYRNSMSRNSSQRTSRNDPLVSNGFLGLIRRSQDMQAARSPFDDPTDEDDPISEVSTIREMPRGQQGDQLSVVSDLSYQEDPVIGRSAV